MEGGGFALLASLPYPSGQGSLAKLAIDNIGNLYGTAWLGNVFKLTPSGGNWILSDLGTANIGMSNSVVVDSNGVIYGAEASGGDYDDGWVFEIMQ